MKKIMIAFLALHITLMSMAQTTPPDSLTILYLTEGRYLSKDALQKNYAATRSFWMKNIPEIIDRFAFSSESRRAYTFTMFKGEKNYGKYIGSRGTTNDAFKKEQPDLTERLRQNAIGATSRSSWTVLRDQSSTEANWNANKYNFRKLHMYTVAYGQTETFEALLKEIKEYEAKINRTLNRIIIRCVDGYSSNTYITMLPDNSVNEFFEHRQARSQNRDPKLVELYEKLYGMMTILRTDDLYRLTF